MNFELDLGKYNDLIFEKNEYYDYVGGIQYVVKFDNGYGASIIKNAFSYGHQDDLWEVGVLKFKDDEYDLVYNTPITDDVIGFLSESDVISILNEIETL